MDKTPQCPATKRRLINQLRLPTERLLVQKFSARDVAHNIRHEMDSQLMKYIRQPWSLAKTRARTLRLAGNWSGKEGEWALAAIRPKALVNDDNSYLGIICLRYESLENNTLEIGWRLGQESQGQGYATEAASAVLRFLWKHVQPHKVVAYCFTENRPSLRVMEKLGLRQEGILRQAERVNGQWHDLAIYGQLKSETSALPETRSNR